MTRTSPEERLLQNLHRQEKSNMAANSCIFRKKSNMAVKSCNLLSDHLKLFSKTARMVPESLVPMNGFLLHHEWQTGP